MPAKVRYYTALLVRLVGTAADGRRWPGCARHVDTLAELSALAQLQLLSKQSPADGVPDALAPLVAKLVQDRCAAAPGPSSARVLARPAAWFH